MKVIKTYPEYIQEAISILKKEKGPVRVSSFNLSVRDKDTSYFLDLTLAAPSFILIGTIYRSCEVGCSACNSANLRRSNILSGFIHSHNIKVTDNLHLKYISRGNKAIIGGMNLTGSNFDDMALVVDNVDTINSMNDYFDSLYNKAKSKSPYLLAVTPVFPYGKYQGKTVAQVQSIDPSYITWAKTNLNESLKKTLQL